MSPLIICKADIIACIRSILAFLKDALKNEFLKWCPPRYNISYKKSNCKFVGKESL
jgi:hypothetical protein